MISRLKYKCLITLEGTLEGNQDLYIVHNLIRAIPPKILNDNLLTVYKNYYRFYNLRYNDEVFKHFDWNVDPDPAH